MYLLMCVTKYSELCVVDSQGMHVYEGSSRMGVRNMTSWIVDIAPQPVDHSIVSNTTGSKNSNMQKKPVHSYIYVYFQDL